MPERSALTKEDKRREILKQFFAFPIPCVFISKGLKPPAGMVEEATKAGVAILISGLKTNEFYNKTKPWLEEEFAATTTLHVVATGESLWSIARDRVGADPATLDRYWRALCDANRAVLRSGDVNLIHPGETVVLPEPLLAGAYAVSWTLMSCKRSLTASLMPASTVH